MAFFFLTFNRRFINFGYNTVPSDLLTYILRWIPPFLQAYFAFQPFSSKLVIFILSQQGYCYLLVIPIFIPHSKITTILNKSLTYVYDFAKCVNNSSVPNYINCCNSADVVNSDPFWKATLLFLMIPSPITDSQMSTGKGSTKFCASISVVLAIMLRSNSKS